METVFTEIEHRKFRQTYTETHTHTRIGATSPGGILPSRKIKIISFVNKQNFMYVDMFMNCFIHVLCME